MDGSRLENSAEHSWQVAIFALVLAEHAAEPVDAARVVAMLLVHDLVEIDAGDTFVYDLAGRADQAERERRAADAIFGLLPEDQGRELRALWEEFEARATAEARFAAAIDRIVAPLANYANRGHSWRINHIEASRVRQVNAPVAQGAPALGEVLARLVEAAVARKWIEP